MRHYYLYLWCGWQNISRQFTNKYRNLILVLLKNMSRILKLVLILKFATLCVAREIADEELHRLPKLFHLDDYDRCLSQTEGIYCVGSFELTPRTTPNPAYEVITERLNQHFSFDRRLLHRGYCVSKRCQPGEQNSTLRFEQCADRSVRKHALTARLKKLSYCTTHAERKRKLSQPPDLPQRVFLYAVYLILFLNVLGTAVDVYGGSKKNIHLVAWSIPANWRALTTVDDGASPFAPVQSAKIILHCFVIYTHAYLLHFVGYMHNPEAVEKSRDSFVNVIIRNGTSLVQVFILYSSFYTGYNVLQTARRSTFSAGLAVRWILKRIFRLAPVYLLLTAYSATWWPRSGDGPLWPTIVEAESQVCRRKFWTHVLFINNFVEPSELCMIQSWGMAAEVQLFLVSLLLTLLLIKLRVRAVPVLGAMFVASCVFNVTLAYAAGLVPMVKVIVPETLRTKFRGSRSFFHLHISLWSNLPACIFGLLVAHVYFEQKNKVNAKTDNDTNVSIQNGTKLENGRFGNGIDARCKENGVNVNDNGMSKKENGLYATEIISLASENELHDKENSACGNKNYKSVYENTIHVKENDVHLNKNDTHVNENDVYVKENDVYVKVNDVHVKENGVNIKENGICCNDNGVHVRDNSLHANGNGVRAENGIRYRKYVSEDRKSNEVNNANHINKNAEKKSNGVANCMINQNGQAKSNGYGYQNGPSSGNEDKKDMKRAPFLLRNAHFFTFPVLIVWVVLGSRVTGVESALAIALYVGLERVMFNLTFAYQLVQVITVKGPWASLLSWRGWAVPARLVLSVVMVHWCVCATMLAARAQPVASSILYVSIDCLATLFYSYVIALPICILVELPMKKALDALIS